MFKRQDQEDTESLVDPPIISVTGDDSARQGHSIPWFRDRIPLIYINEELAVVPGFCVGKKFSASKNEKSLDIHWSGYNKVLG